MRVPYATRSKFVTSKYLLQRRKSEGKKYIWNFYDDNLDLKICKDICLYRLFFLFSYIPPAWKCRLLFPDPIHWADSEHYIYSLP